MKLLKILLENYLEEDYPTSWNIEEFKNLKSFNQRIKYCEEHLTRISSGSSRIVYKIDEVKVLKLAKNKKGIAQNEVEIEYSNDYMWDSVVAQVFDYDENYLWLEMELARKLTTSAFKNITGFSFFDYSDALQYTYDMAFPRKSKGFKRDRPSNYDDMFEQEFIADILGLIGSYDNIIVGDLKKTSSYGLVNRNGEDQVVMIDYGLTSDVYDSFYS
jgi:hypothetical protein